MNFFVTKNDFIKIYIFSLTRDGGGGGGCKDKVVYPLPCLALATPCGCQVLPGVGDMWVTPVNPFTLKSSSRNILCYFHTFENNLGLKQNFTKYLKEICSLSSDQHFSFKYFQKKCFCKGNISKIFRPLLSALSVNGLNRAGLEGERVNQGLP